MVEQADSRGRAQPLWPRSAWRAMAARARIEEVCHPGSVGAEMNDKDGSLGSAHSHCNSGHQTRPRKVFLSDRSGCENCIMGLLAL